VTEKQIRELIAQWRKHAASLTSTDSFVRGAQSQITNCANELEEALRVALESLPDEASPD
jgi:hypothetical protein